MPCHLGPSAWSSRPRGRTSSCERIQAADSHAAIEAAPDAARKERPAIPDYAFDVHTSRGRARGATRKQFFKDEFEALQPRLPGLFDDVLE